VWHAREIVVQSGLALRVERFLTRHFADCVICMSQAIADQLPGAPTVVIHETADPSEFAPARAGRFRAAVGIPDDVPLAGAAGRVDSWKGFDVLLDAFAFARDRLPQLHLVVLGGPVTGKEELFRALEARATALPGVSWLGARSDVPDALADLDVFVLPSTEPEPYGLVLVEALASGVPVVATDAGGPPEIVRAARPGSGRLVTPRDPAALADAIVDSITESIGASPSTSAASRAARPRLRDPEPEQFGDVFRGVVAAHEQ
jgi:glycosyltransferase involved in cell wall biosynthesis